MLGLLLAGQLHARGPDRAEEFFEVDVAAALEVPGTERASDDPEPRRALKLFFLFFNRAAFLGQTWDTAQRSFHAYARSEARLYEERVSKDLGERVFGDIFPSWRRRWRAATSRCARNPSAAAG